MCDWSSSNSRATDLRSASCRSARCGRSTPCAWLCNEPTRFLVSKTEIRRILADEEIRHHHVRLWLHSPDPNFRKKVRAICDVYLAKPAPGDTVLCIDEKTGMQALEHKHPFKQPVRGRAGRREFEYIRHGSKTLFAAFNPHSGHLFGECSERRKAA